MCVYIYIYIYCPVYWSLCVTASLFICVTACATLLVRDCVCVTACARSVVPRKGPECPSSGNRQWTIGNEELATGNMQSLGSQYN